MSRFCFNDVDENGGVDNITAWINYAGRQNDDWVSFAIEIS